MNNKPIIYYAKWPGIKDEDLIVETNQLARIDYYKNKAKFTPLQGWYVLKEIIKQNREDILNATIFISNSGQIRNLESILNELISKMKIDINNLDLEDLDELPLKEKILKKKKNDKKDDDLKKDEEEKQ